MLNESMSHEDFTTVVVSLWAIWTARRKALHEELFQSPMTTFGFIQSYLKDLQLIPAKVESKVEASRSTSSTKMIRPPPSFMKINVDAAVLRTGTRGSVSALCRSEQGVFVGASTRVIDGVFDPAILEAMACAEGLSLAQDLQLQRICLASDCLEVVQSVMASSMGKYGIIIKEIKARKAAFDEVQICHEGRKNNTETHMLARNVISDVVGRCM
jgi:ribonuclease HI